MSKNIFRSSFFSLALSIVGPLTSLALLTATLSTPGCSTDPPAEVDRQSVLRDTASKVIVPTYDELASKVSLLEQAARDLAASPDATTLAAAQSAWRSARSPLKRSEAFFLGPVDTMSIGANLETWPVLESDLDTIVAGADTIDATYVATLGANKKGFFALEVLLFDRDGGDAAVVDRLSGDTNVRRRDLLVAMASDLASNASKLADAWNPKKGNFAREFSESGKGGTGFDTQKKAFDALVNASLRSAEIVVATGLAEPIGKRNNGVPEPDEQRAGRSDNTRQDIIDQIAGVEAVYRCSLNGATGASLSSVVREKTAPIDDAFLQHIKNTQASFDAIPPSFSEALSTSLPVLETAYERSNDLKRSLQTEVSSVLGVTLAFNDTDGDLDRDAVVDRACTRQVVRACFVTTDRVVSYRVWQPDDRARRALPRARLGRRILRRASLLF